MSDRYTLANLRAVEDAAPKFGFAEVQQARFANGALDTEQTGLAYHCIMPGMRQAFAHRHERAEEVYVVLRGGGRVKLDEDVLELAALDALRVAPAVTRAFEAGPEGLELLAFGPRHAGDGELEPDFWTD
jgi:mannose-6-phosphate isomerase-like protein (cupin superfamily)